LGIGTALARSGTRALLGCGRIVSLSLGDCLDRLWCNRGRPKPAGSEVEKKQADWNLIPNQAALQSNLLQTIEPVVVGPGGQLY
jgi:hypothetical protein